MIKLLHEDENIEFYVDMLQYEETLNDLDEDMVQPDEEIQDGNNYKNVQDTRAFLRMYLNDVVKTIKQYNCVKSCWVRGASKKTKTGLSNYIDIVFIHPDGLSEEEITKNYKYSIRFSDHKHEEKRKLPDILQSIHIVGMKPKNFEKAARSAFNKYLNKAQTRISNFEQIKYGKVIIVLNK